MRQRVATLGVAEEDDAPPARTRRDWIVDSLLFALAIGLGIVALVSSIDDGLRGPLVVVDAGAGVALCVALWWRRRWPFTLALGGAAAGAFSSFAGPAALVLLFTVAAYRRWQLAVLIACLVLALVPVARAVHPQQDTLAAEYLVGTSFLAVVIFFGMLMRGRRQAQRERTRRAQAEERLRIEQARHAERTRIAREMHDVLAHRISLLSLHAGALEFRPDAPPEEIARAAGVIRASAHQALEDLRTVIGMLRDGTPDADSQAPQPPQPTLASLPGLLAESRAAGMQLHADVRLDPVSVPDGVGRNALRIVQEALTNARKHARSAPVALRLDGAPGRGLEIEVRNPAPTPTGGVAGIPGSGTGLVGLRERATLSGGRLEHRVDEHGDFQLRAWLPWPQ